MMRPLRRPLRGRHFPPLAGEEKRARLRALGHSERVRGRLGWLIGIQTEPTPMTLFARLATIALAAALFAPVAFATLHQAAQIV